MMTAGARDPVPPDGQVQRERVAVVHVGQDREPHLRLRSQLGHEFLPVGHDADDLPALRGNLAMRLRQRIDIDAAVGTPMPAVEGHGHRSISQKLVETDEVSAIAG